MKVTVIRKDLRGEVVENVKETKREGGFFYILESSGRETYICLDVIDTIRIE